MPTVVSHGNAKTEKPFYPTLPSTVHQIKAECVVRGPKEVVASVSSTAGGITGAKYPGELPRNEQQIINFKQQIPKSVSTSLRVQMGVHRYATSPLGNTDKKFACEIKAYREPAILLASERQLHDVSWFCCDRFEYCDFLTWQL